MKLFNPDQLACVVTLLVLFIGGLVLSFSSRYMQGDPSLKRFQRRCLALVVSLIALASADHGLLFFLAWIFSNSALLLLMNHNGAWKEARAAALLAGRTFLLGAVLMFMAFLILWIETGTWSIAQMVEGSGESFQVRLALLLLFLGACIQSALWPFHRWLISSLNSPTPVSALMHAGLVNGGGFILVRFAPLYLKTPELLTLMFVIGLGTALVATLWKLMQPSVKRMLACSTVGQMGFMVVQCSLGLFPAAVAHLCFHGCFKAYLFLSSGAAAQERRAIVRAEGVSQWLVAMFCGLVTGYCFSWASHHPFITDKTTIFLSALACMAGFHVALPLIKTWRWSTAPLVLLTAISTGIFYGASVFCVERLFDPVGIYQPQTLTLLHYLGLLLLVGSWMLQQSDFYRLLHRTFPGSMDRIYVKALSASEPHPSTITVNRLGYRFI